MLRIQQRTIYFYYHSDSIKDQSEFKLIVMFQCQSLMPAVVVIELWGSGISPASANEKPPVYDGTNRRQESYGAGTSDSASPTARSSPYFYFNIQSLAR